MNHCKWLASGRVGVLVFFALALLGAAWWATSRDPFKRMEFTLETANSGKVKGIAVLPKPVRPLPTLVYLYGAGGDLIHSGTVLREIAELGMAAVSIEYDQSDEAAFDEQFSALCRYLPTQRWVQTNSVAWLGFSLGAQRTLSFLVRYPEQQPEVYVRMAGGWLPELEEAGKLHGLGLKSSAKVLLVHGEQDQIFPAASSSKVARFFRQNGVDAQLHLLPGKEHAFGTEQALVFRLVSEYCKTQLTPRHPQPNLPQLHSWPFWICMIPAGFWLGGWFFLRWRYCRVAKDKPEVPATKINIALPIAAVVLTVIAAAQTSLHLIVPYLKINQSTLQIGRKFLVPPESREAFEFLAAQPVWKQASLKTLLEHLELASLTTKVLVNWKVDEELYREFVLSPTVDPARDTELGWRRPLWEYFYPRIRKEENPESAALIVIRCLREKVMITPDKGSFTGVESIWNKQFTTDKDFDLIYTAALRSVGIPARLNQFTQAEFWDGSIWRTAPRPPIDGFKQNVK